MARGYEYSAELKGTFFRVISFIESEKNGTQIPVYNTTQRIQAILGISERSIFNLKREMKHLAAQVEIDQKKKEEENRKEMEIQQNAEMEQLLNTIRRRSQSMDATTVSNASAALDQVSSYRKSKRKWEASIPRAKSPLKRGHSGRPAVILSEQAEDTIRFTFHAMLAEKVYPTTSTLLARLLNAHEDFPIRSVTTLWRHMRRLGFSYKSTSKIPVVLDDVSFVAQRASYFRRLNELRESGAFIYYHDETWLNAGEEKRNIWIDEKGKGRLRKHDGKGKRIAISAMIGVEGFVEPFDVWLCDSDHAMNSDRFHKWIGDAAGRLRIKHGAGPTIVIIIDNATWHNVLCDDAKPPKRAWRKDQLQEWLDDRKIQWDAKSSKAELLQLAFANVPPKRYVTNAIARAFDVEIFRLPIKHCVLNPIELAWAQLKSYVRRENVNFRISDVENLALEFMAAVDKDLAQSFIEHTQKVEEIFKTADAFVEDSVEPQLIDTDDENDLELHDPGECDSSE
jgi:hypothetical protein